MLNETTRLNELLEFLFSRINYERRPERMRGQLKLETMRRLLRRLGDPQQKLSIIHVAGTKGKGSVSAMVAAALSAAGRKTGVYSSPHLESLNERISVDGQMISNRDLEHALEVVCAVAKQMDIEDQFGPTFFEIVTATAIWHFAKSSVDYAVLEVGLGGRLDSTNVCLPQVAVITSISRDHMKQLGHSLSEIAAEKAGIIKPNIPVISGVGEEPARSVIRAKAAACNAPLFEFGRDFHLVLGSTSPTADGNQGDNEGTESITGKRYWTTWGTIKGHRYRISDFRCSMPGDHQAHNAAVAMAAVHCLTEKTCRRFGPDQLARAIRAVRLPGRMEVVSRSPLIVLDIAHNEASLLAMASTLRDQFAAWNRASNKVLVLAVSKDKEINDVLPQVLGGFHEVLVTKFIGNPRSVEPSELKARIDDALLRLPGAEPSTLPLIRTAATPAEAWADLMPRCERDWLVCVTGSTFLVAELRPVVLAAFPPAASIADQHLATQRSV